MIDAQPAETLESIFDLFLALEANDSQLDFHHLYASGRNGWAVNELEDERKDLSPLFKRIVEDVPAPKPRALATEDANPIINAPFAAALVRAVGIDFFTRVIDGGLTRSRMARAPGVIGPTLASVASADS